VTPRLASFAGRAGPDTRDYRSTVDRVAIARAERRRQVTEELESERDRAAQLLEQRDGIILELDGAGVDEEVFAKMPPEDVDLIRGALQGGPEALREGFDEEWLDLAGDDAEVTVVEEDIPDPEQWAIEQRRESEAEIVRLDEEIAASNRRQEALQRYLDLLEDGNGGETAAAGPTLAELEAAWDVAEPAPRASGTVRGICVRVDDGVHETPEHAEVTVEDGLVGDRWATGKRDLDAQITLMNVRVAEVMGGPLDLAGDNFQVDLDLSEDALPVGTRLRLGEALLEVSPAPHTGCKKFKERFGLDALKWVNDNRDRRLRGMNCRVVEAGAVAVGDPVVVV
jgi:MOSC domain